MAESNLNLDRKNRLFGRVTYVQKTADDLQVPDAAPGSRYDLYGISAGYARDCSAGRAPAWESGFGVASHSSRSGTGLRDPHSGRDDVYLRLRPAAEGGQADR